MLARNINGLRWAWPLEQDFDQLFSNFIGDLGGTRFEGIAGVAAFPPVNVWDEGESLVAEAELPGLTLEDIEVFVCGDELTIKGERRGLPSEGVTCHRRERGEGRFTRLVRLPVGVDADRVEATLKNGILTVKMPKSKEVLPRKVAVSGR